VKLKTAILRFDRQLAADGRSRHTRAAYRRDLTALSGWLGGNPELCRITPDDLARLLISDAVILSPTGRSWAAISVNRTKSALRSFFAFCVESGFLNENPALLIRSSRTAVKSPATLTESEIRRLREVVGDNGDPLAHRDSLILELLLGTGIRLGSLVALNLGDVDLRSGSLRIRLKGGTEGRVFPNPELRCLPDRYLKETTPRGNSGPDTPLFRTSTGRRLGARQVQPRFAQLCREAGIDRSLSVHSLRHTFATRLYEKTGDLHLVQRALGHRQITTTEVYARVSDRALRSAIYFM
jgi:integrase/recombinase XerC